MHDPLRHGERGPGRNVIAADRAITAGNTGDDPGRGIQPQGLLDDRLRVAQPWHIGVGRRTLTKDMLEFISKPIGDIGMVGKYIPSPRQC